MVAELGNPQLTDVPDVHRAVAHVTCAIDDVVLKSMPPKCNPVTVTELAPVEGMFCNILETTGASNVKCDSCVPTTAPSVSCIAVNNASLCEVTHDTDVLDDHAEVPQKLTVCIAVLEKL